jgi:hypothetical protein
MCKMTKGGSHLKYNIDETWGIARWPQHYHLHFNKNVNEKEKHEGVTLNP